MYQKQVRSRTVVPSTADNSGFKVLGDYVLYVSSFFVVSITMVIISSINTASYFIFYWILSTLFQILNLQVSPIALYHVSMGLFACLFAPFSEEIYKQLMSRFINVFCKYPKHSLRRQQLQILVARAFGIIEGHAFLPIFVIGYEIIRCLTFARLVITQGFINGFTRAHFLSIIYCTPRMIFQTAIFVTKPICHTYLTLKNEPEIEENPIINPKSMYRHFRWNTICSMDLLINFVVASIFLNPATNDILEILPISEFDLQSKIVFIRNTGFFSRSYQFFSNRNEKIIYIPTSNLLNWNSTIDFMGAISDPIIIEILLVSCIFSLKKVFDRYIIKIKLTRIILQVMHQYHLKIEEELLVDKMKEKLLVDKMKEKLLVDKMKEELLLDKMKEELLVNKMKEELLVNKMKEELLRDQQISTNDQQISTNDQQISTNDQQISTNDQQISTDGNIPIISSTDHNIELKSKQLQPTSVFTTE